MDALWYDLALTGNQENADMLYVQGDAHDKRQC